MPKLFTVGVLPFQNHGGIVPAEYGRIQGLVIIGRKRVRQQNRWQAEIRDLTQASRTGARNDQVCRSIYILHLVVESSDERRNSLLLILIVNKLVFLASSQVDELHRLHCEMVQSSYYGFV